MKKGYEKYNFKEVKDFPEAHTYKGKKVPPDGNSEPWRPVNVSNAPSTKVVKDQEQPIGLSYPDGQDFGPYIQNLGEGLPSSFSLNLKNNITFSCGNVHPHTALMLYTFVLNQRPMSIVETGTFYGYSTWFMAEALKLWGDGGTIYTIESDPKLICKEVRDHPNIQIIEGRSENVLPEILPQIKEVDFAFIDSYKRFALGEFELIHPFVSEGGLAVFHDTQFLNTGFALHSFLSKGLEDIYDQILFCGTPKKNNPNHYFGNADDRGLYILRKKEQHNPFLEVADCDTAHFGNNLIKGYTNE